MEVLREVIQGGRTEVLAVETSKLRLVEFTVNTRILSLYIIGKDSGRMRGKVM